MGWPLAVSAGLMERSSRALVAALWPLSVGHLLAMLLVLLPFGLLVTLVEWQRQIQVSASLLVIGFGIFRLVNTRHPRALARIRPTQPGLWSFAVAIAHGAGLMLVPIHFAPRETSNSNIRVRTMYLRNRDEFPSAPSQRATRDYSRELRCRTRSSGRVPGLSGCARTNLWTASAPAFRELGDWPSQGLRTRQDRRSRSARTYPGARHGRRPRSP